jgi:hypothetical protein
MYAAPARYEGNCSSIAVNPNWYLSAWGIYQMGFGSNWNEFDLLDLATTTPPGYIPFGTGAQADCPGCYVNPATDQEWYPGNLIWSVDSGSGSLLSSVGNALDNAYGKALSTRGQTGSS